MFFISFGKRAFKGKLTPEKERRIKRLRWFHFRRHHKIQRDFDATAKAKAIIESADKAIAGIKKMLRLDPTSIPNRRRKLKSLYLKKHSKRIRYFKELRHFAEKQGASHYFLKRIDGRIADENFTLEKAIKDL